MERARCSSGPGTAIAVGATAELALAAAERMLERPERDHELGAIRLGGHDVWCKSGPVRGSGRLRYGLRRVVGLAPPRVRELRNLAWLSERLFRVPTPLAAGFVARGPLVVHQMLATEVVADARTLPEALRTRSGASAREPLVLELAREVARMHALRFVHRDLHARNVLVTPPVAGDGDPRRLVFVDAWKGGPRHPFRSAAYDLACLLLDGAGVMDAGEQELLLATYVDERAAQGRAVERDALVRDVARERAALVRTVRRDPSRWREPEPLVPDWP